MYNKLLLTYLLTYLLILHAEPGTRRVRDVYRGHWSGGQQKRSNIAQRCSYTVIQQPWTKVQLLFCDPINPVNDLIVLKVLHLHNAFDSWTINPSFHATRAFSCSLRSRFCRTANYY